jgi:hypothetical protein
MITTLKVVNLVRVVTNESITKASERLTLGKG